MTGPQLSALTPEELAARWQSTCRRHDSLVDCAEIGDERIYFAGKELDSIEDEFNSQGLSHFDFIRNDGAAS